MDLRIPGHEILEELTREPSGARRVFRTRCAERECATRVICTAVGAPLEGLVRAVVLRGKGSAMDLGYDVVATLEGYRVRHLLGELPGLPPVLEAGLCWPAGAEPGAAGFPFVTTGWVRGRTLAELEGGDPSLCAEALRGVLALLRDLHARRVLYGDLKPANVVWGQDGLHLIDLDTLREVPDPGQPVRVTHRTAAWAAPEQELNPPLAWLASDLYAFGAMSAVLLGGRRPGEPGFPPELPAPWREVVQACLRPRPQDRPNAEQILDWLGSGLPQQRAPAWAGAGPDQATTRVPDAAVAAAFGAGPAAPAPPAPPPVPPAPLPRRREPGTLGGARALLASLGLLGLAAAGLGLALLLGAAWALSEWSDRREADRQAAELMEQLRIHKTDKASNQRSDLDPILSRAEAAVALAPTAEALGVLALARAWSHVWQWTPSRKAPWDADAFAQDLALAERALEAGPSASAWLARALVAAGACRKHPEGAERPAWCERGADWADEALARIPGGAGGDWLRVEAVWTAVLAEHALGDLVLEEDRPRALRAWESVLERCSGAEGLLGAAPINAVYLAEKCAEASGRLKALPQYLRWTDWLVARDLEEDNRLSADRAREVVTALDPSCKDVLRFDASGLPLRPAGTRDGGLADLCGYVGLSALGCRAQAEAFHPCATWSASFWSPSCLQRARQPGLPWEEAEQAAASPPRTSCAFGS